ncbi:X-Pro dipeptidase [Agrobacterium vitis]|uniref:M24 family metallopeptidase n=1 Tax=Agrobacterium vitis TaxID=373 RepID=UPI0015DB8BFA|nr:Xaa-Pro peptidase family protein [Agrobacterium vitis]BCH66527.1 X-Pro dipeptidase [Agrobacterium vitis]
MSSPVSPPKISMEERVLRLETLRKTMAEKDIGAVLIGSTESLRYFTGLVWHGSERLVGAVITASELVYVVPGFERSRVETLPHLPGDIRVWEEDESSAALVASFLPHASTLAVDDSVPLFVYNALKREIAADRLIDGGPLLRGQRLRKSAAEIAIIQYAMNLTLDVQRKAHAMIRPGIAASEVVRFIDGEHRRLGASNGSTFCIVSFGETTSLPHGADGEQYYQPGDVVLVDTGCRIDGYNSDITRTYMLEEPTAEFARIWDIERAAQQAVFDAARIGATCGSLDDAARDVLTRHGLGPDYQLPGLPHRAGHGLGLEGHEEPYIVRGNTVRLDAGMCFSCEPMIVLPGQFGLRLEDIIYMTSDGPNWFTQPAKGPTEPFSG